MANALDATQLYKLARAIEKHLPELDQRRMTMEEAAEYMSGKVGFPVTKANISTAQKAAEVKWRHRTGCNFRTLGPTSGGSDRLRRLARIVKYQQEQIDKLYEQLGETPPEIHPDLRPLISGNPENVTTTADN